MLSQGVGRTRNYKLGAVLFDKKGKVISVASNSYRTHPVWAKYTEFPFLHAESHAIIRRGLDNCSSLSLLVVRTLANGNLSMATPCQQCQTLIRDAGIKNVYYSNWNGEIECLKYS